MKITNILISLTALVLLSSCQDKMNEKIYGKWQVAADCMKDKSIPFREITYEFKKTPQGDSVYVNDCISYKIIQGDETTVLDSVKVKACGTYKIKEPDKKMGLSTYTISLLFDKQAMKVDIPKKGIKIIKNGKDELTPEALDYIYPQLCKTYSEGQAKIYAPSHGIRIEMTDNDNIKIYYNPTLVMSRIK